MKIPATLARLTSVGLILGALFAQTGYAGAAATWTIVTSPNRGTRFNDLVAVAASATTDVWAVGSFANSTGPYKTLAEHWNGASWQTVSTPNVGTGYNFLNGVAALSTTDAWAVGQSFTTQYQSVTEHWNGTAWTVVASPNVGTGSNLLNAVAAVSSTDVWAVGENGNNQTLVEHWNGTSWSVVASPNVGTNPNILTAMAVISSTDVWAVGRFGQEASTLAEHWDGSTWSVVASPNPGIGDNVLSSVTAIASNDVWAVGAKAEGTETLSEHWNGTAWSAVPTPNPVPAGTGNDFLGGVAALSSSDVWSVGSSLNFVKGSLNQTIGEQWNGTSWSVASTPNSGTGSNVLNGVTAISGGTVWAVGHAYPTVTGPQRTLIVRTTQG